jgi:hypothetical protein
VRLQYDFEISYPFSDVVYVWYVYVWKWGWKRIDGWIITSCQTASYRDGTAGISAVLENRYFLSNTPVSIGIARDFRGEETPSFFIRLQSVTFQTWDYWISPLTRENNSWSLHWSRRSCLRHDRPLCVVFQKSYLADILVCMCLSAMSL